MNSRRNLLVPSVAIGLIILAGLFLARYASPPAFAQGSTNPNATVGPSDFSNLFYNENGINLSKLAAAGGRVGVDSGGNPCTQTIAGGRNTVCNGGGFGFPNGAVGTATALNWVTDTSNTDPTRTSTRILQTTGGFDMNGNLIFYSIMGTVNDDSFFDDADCPTSSDPQFDFTGCGTRANTLANKFRAFIQPKQINPNTGFLRFPTGCTTVDTSTGFPPGIQPTVVDANCAANGIKFAPPPPNRRQDNVFDTQSGYFCKNLQGLWILVFTLYTPNAYLPNGQYASSAAQAAIAPIAAANGTNLDGTAVLERTSEIDSLTAQGFLNEFVMPRAAHGGAPRYVV